MDDPLEDAMRKFDEAVDGIELSLILTEANVLRIVGGFGPSLERRVAMMMQALSVPRNGQNGT